jgi:hypothetical protein
MELFATWYIGIAMMGLCSMLLNECFSVWTRRIAAALIVVGFVISLPGWVKGTEKVARIWWGLW